jgi:hypothetical protein
VHLPLRCPSVRRRHPVWLPVLVAATALLAACGAGAGHGDGTPTPATSGIDLLTMAGPTCPVQRQGQVCEEAISARVLVQTSLGATVTTVQTGADGKARVPLQPGSYMLVPQPGSHQLPRPPQPATVTVTAGQFASVRLDYDTGIR